MWVGWANVNCLIVLGVKFLVDYDATPTAFLGWVRRNVLRLYMPAAFLGG